jgi:hypothetical protein
MSMRSQRRRFAFLASVLLAASAQAEGEPIYTWMDEKGQIHFTATPPPRNARPVATRPEAKQPIQIVPMPTPAKPTSVGPRSARPRVSTLREPRARSASTEPVDCGRHASSLERVRSAQRSIDALRSSIEQLESDSLSSSRTSCTARGERLGVCQDGSYNRDRELDRARAKLQAAEDELGDAEQAARAASVPPECMSKD